MQLLGLVMNSLQLASQAFIANGWELFQLAKDLNPSRTYRVHHWCQDAITAGKNICRNSLSVWWWLCKSWSGETIEVQDNPWIASRYPHTTAIEIKRVPDTSQNSLPTKLAPKTQQIYEARRETPSTQQHNGDIWSEVLNIIAQEVGFPTSQVEKESELSSLGIDSLLSLTILSHLEEHQVDVRRTLFEDFSTIEDLRNYFTNTTSVTNRGDRISTSSDVVLTPSTTSKADSDTAQKVSAFCSIIARGIGIPPDDLQEAEDLSAMRLDSLMGLNIAGAAREQLGTISPDILSSQSSILEIERAIGLYTQSTSPSPASPLSRWTKNGAENPFSFPRWQWIGIFLYQAFSCRSEHCHIWTQQSISKSRSKFDVQCGRSC